MKVSLWYFYMKSVDAGLRSLLFRLDCRVLLRSILQSCCLEIKTGAGSFVVIWESFMMIEMNEMFLSFFILFEGARKMNRQRNGREGGRRQCRCLLYWLQGVVWCAARHKCVRLLGHFPTFVMNPTLSTLGYCDIPGYGLAFQMFNGRMIDWLELDHRIGCRVTPWRRKPGVVFQCLVWITVRRGEGGERCVALNLSKAITPYTIRDRRWTCHLLSAVSNYGILCMLCDCGNVLYLERHDHILPILSRTWAMPSADHRCMK